MTSSASVSWHIDKDPQTILPSRLFAIVSTVRIWMDIESGTIEYNLYFTSFVQKTSDWVNKYLLIYSCWFPNKCAHTFIRPLLILLMKLINFFPSSNFLLFSMFFVYLRWGNIFWIRLDSLILFWKCGGARIDLNLLSFFLFCTLNYIRSIH